MQGPIFAEWFKGGKTNIAYNCLDRHVKEGFGDQVGRSGQLMTTRPETVWIVGHLPVCCLRRHGTAAPGLAAHAPRFPRSLSPQDCFLFEGNDVGRDGRMTYAEVRSLALRLPTAGSPARRMAGCAVCSRADWYTS